MLCPMKMAVVHRDDTKTYDYKKEDAWSCEQQKCTWWDKTDNCCAMWQLHGVMKIIDNLANNLKKEK